MNVALSFIPEIKLIHARNMSVRDNSKVTQFAWAKIPRSEADDEARRWLRTPGQVY